MFLVGLEADLTLSAIPFQAHFGDNSLLLGTLLIHTSMLPLILLVAEFFKLKWNLLTHN